MVGDIVEALKVDCIVMVGIPDIEGGVTVGVPGIDALVGIPEIEGGVIIVGARVGTPATDIVT